MNPSIQANVLVVEDDRLYRETFCKLLNLSFPNIQITAVADGSAALNMTRQTSFDLIILDYQLTTITGGDVVRLLRRRSQSTGFLLPPIVLMSTLPDIAVLGRTMGATATLGKPAMPDDVTDVIEPLLEQQTGQPEANHANRQLSASAGPRRTLDGRLQLPSLASKQEESIPE